MRCVSVKLNHDYLSGTKWHDLKPTCPFPIRFPKAILSVWIRRIRVVHPKEFHVMNRFLFFTTSSLTVFSLILLASLDVQSKPASASERDSIRDSAGTKVKDMPAGKPQATGKAKGDSIETLKFILQTEFKSNEQIYRLKMENLADSVFSNAPSMTLPQIQTLLQDSSRTEKFLSQEGFKTYWSRVEQESGITAVKGQYMARDPDRSRIPKIYLADSSIVILPGWIVLRKRK